nr:mitochondrial inner membrane protease subunit 1 [Ipomoea batatas]
MISRFFRHINVNQWGLKAKEGFQQSLLFVKFLCILHVADRYVCSPILVYGPSMLPTLNLTGDVLLVEHVSPLLGKVGPGDVVLVRATDNPRKTITKRIMGMEGDYVTYLAEPGRSDRSITVKCRCQRGMFGFKEITSMHPRIQGNLDQSHMVSFWEKSSIGYGHPKALGLWHRNYNCSNGYIEM